ncbi:MAG: Sir2 family NAD-dependent protein deacetylase [Angustibacter sp.]
MAHVVDGHPVVDGWHRALDEAAEVLAVGRVVALTGAGLSTDSGIPDYRGPSAPARRPMTYQEFVSGPDAQRRYWARSHLGWRLMRDAAPNGGHRALAALEGAGVLRGLITQNVDGLHQSAGSRDVVDLHGRIADVVCLRCGQVTSRAALHERLIQLNPGFAERVLAETVRSAGPAGPAGTPAGATSGAAKPDGDVELTDPELIASFRLAGCLACRGLLKPDVVFFGENVPRERVQRCYAMVADAGALLVAGTSLTVQSGLRFVRRAHRDGTPVVLANRGPTRGDDLVAVRLDAGCTEVLTGLAAHLPARQPTT